MFWWNQTKELHESWWELTSESLYESFINSHVLVKREQELHESWWELTGESFYESSFSNSHVLSNKNKSCMIVNKSRYKCEFAWQFSQL